jgi:predicted nucleotidyltransferase
MTKKALKSEPVLPTRLYQSPNIPMAAIRRYARRIAEQFKPDKIILFGSYAYGTPHEDSDVDLLVVMPASNESSQSVRIRLALEPSFPMDLVVCTPARLKREVSEDNWFFREVTEKGKILYDKTDGKVGPQSRSRSGRRTKVGSAKGTAS